MVLTEPCYVEKRIFIVCKVSEFCIVADRTVEPKCRLNNEGISLAIYIKTKGCFILAA